MTGETRTEITGAYSISRTAESGTLWGPRGVAECAGYFMPSRLSSIICHVLPVGTL